MKFPLFLEAHPRFPVFSFDKMLNVKKNITKESILTMSIVLIFFIIVD